MRCASGAPGSSAAVRRRRADRTSPPMILSSGQSLSCGSIRSKCRIQEPRRRAPVRRDHARASRSAGGFPNDSADRSPPRTVAEKVSRGETQSSASSTQQKVGKCGKLNCPNVPCHVDVMLPRSRHDQRTSLVPQGEYPAYAFLAGFHMCFDGRHGSAATLLANPSGPGSHRSFFSNDAHYSLECSCRPRSKA